jgi:hypothetical protein
MELEKLSKTKHWGGGITALIPFINKGIRNNINKTNLILLSD